VIPITRHRLWQLAADAVLIAAAWWLAFQLRWDHGVPPPYQRLFEHSILIVVAINLVVFVLAGFYRRWWRYVSTRDIWGAARGVAIGCIIADLTVYLAHPVQGFPLPRGVAVLDFLLLLAFVTGSRLLARTVTERPAPGRLVVRGKEVIVVGAGDAAWQVVRQMLRTPELGYTPIGLVDDDPKKRNIQLEGVRVIGTTGELPHILRDSPPDEILIAIPSAPGELRERVVEAARVARVPVKTVPGLHELISGRVSVSQIRPVQVEDLLGREAVEVDLESIASYLRDEVVLVTGAGGSIGSELCRQIVRVGPKRLVLVDHGETPLFELERELVHERNFTATVPVLGDVKSETRMRQLFESYRPSVVFHAAAYKHVPMMEANPLESVRNNVLATKVVADVAVEMGAERFVLVSTDKALNPAAVYGQSKAICEWIVEAYGARRDVSTRFVAVRFGNVLGSAGSVITIFRRQIEQGGPVTVTHPEMTRYFMTIPEAAQLVVQAGAIGGRGEIFVLDMGEPVRIVDLARDMITLSGREPGREIPIEFIGARAGEKLHEELFGEGETVLETPHPKIRRATRPPVDAAWLDEELGELERLVDAGETLEVVAKLAAMMREPRRVTSSVESAQPASGPAAAELA
jgi:FlaA1/EpsC-like NDP-sugar epimerase